MITQACGIPFRVSTNCNSGQTLANKHDSYLDCVLKQGGLIRIVSRHCRRNLKPEAFPSSLKTDGSSACLVQLRTWNLIKAGEEKNLNWRKKPNYAILCFELATWINLFHLITLVTNQKVVLNSNPSHLNIKSMLDLNNSSQNGRSSTSASRPATQGLNPSTSFNKICPMFGVSANEKKSSSINTLIELWLHWKTDWPIVMVE